RRTSRRSRAPSTGRGRGGSSAPRRAGWGRKRSAATMPRAGASSSCGGASATARRSATSRASGRSTRTGSITSTRARATDSGRGCTRSSRWNAAARRARSRGSARSSCSSWTAERTIERRLESAVAASDPDPSKRGDDADLDRLLAAAFARPSPSAEPSQRPAPDRPLEEPVDVSDRYVVLGELGRGRVGVVLRGRDRELERDVAIKVLRPEHQAHEALSARFVAEARIGGHLEHPGTVPVYEMGRTKDARPYFTMKLVQGRTLASLLGAR